MAHATGNIGHPPTTTTEYEHTARTDRADQILQRVVELAAKGQYDKAIKLLNSAGLDWRFLNAKGVCLMRQARFDEAIQLYHKFVFNPGCTWLRPGLPTLYKTNCATALLLGGHASGCLDILAEVRDEQNVAVQQLRAAIKKWQATFSLWEKLNWRFGRIEPANRPVPMDCEPGIFEPVPGRGETQGPATRPRRRKSA